jgi:hypothetical protein
MTPEQFLSSVIEPGITDLHRLGGPTVSRDAQRMLLAIALQESGPNLNARYQSSPSTSPGPARGWWQFEQGGGVAGVLAHGSSKDLAGKACALYSVVAAQAAVWRALEGHDRLAACFARLLLLTDPPALPTSQQAGWDCYMRLWRPGKPHPENWPANWQTATQSTAATTT